MGMMEELHESLILDAPKEDARFCYHCGGLLRPAADNSKPSHQPRFGACMECGQSWTRLISGHCPTCGPEGGFTHLQLPTGMETSEEFVESAVGTGWCDCCMEPSIYRWHRGGGDPQIQLYGIGEAGQVLLVGGRAREVVATDS